MQHGRTIIRVCLVYVVLIALLFPGCMARKDVTLPKNLSDSMTAKAFIKDTQVDNYSYDALTVKDTSKKTYVWAHELMASEEKVKDMRFLMYSGFNIGIDGKSDDYWIYGYSDSFERMYYLHVEDGVGTVYEMKKPTDYIFSAIDTTSKMRDPADMISEAVLRGGECPEGMIMEINTSSTKAIVGCPGKWRYIDIEYMRLSGSRAVSANDD